MPGAANPVFALGLFGSGPAVTPEGRAFEAAAGQ